MAEKQQKPSSDTPVKFPPNWSKMTRQEKLAWQEQNRKGFKAADRGAPKSQAAQPAAPPQMGLAPAPEQPRGTLGDEHAGADFDTNGDGDTEVNDESVAGAAKGVDAQRAISRMLHALADSFDAAARGE